ncbi:membrane dipeptidase [bacterium]|nr:membrane dipeptidase [bacterium]
MALSVFDLHCDTIDRVGMLGVDPHDPSSLADGPHGMTLSRNDAALSIDRMVDEAGDRIAWCQCYGIWIPEIRHSHDAVNFYREARDWFHEQMAVCADDVTQVRDARKIDEVIASGRVAAMLTLENALPIGHSIRAIDELVEDGVKMVTLTWNGRNAIGSGHDNPLEGLTTFGREAIRAFEDARIVLDVSHLNDLCFHDFLDTYRRPFVASHSNARAICDVPRNLTDDEFRAIRDAGGLVGLNYCRGFLSPRFANVGADAAGGADDEDAVAAAGGEVTFDEVAAHIEHFLDLGGQDVIALGSDYDGTAVPAWLSTCDKVAAFRGRVAERFGETVAQRMFFQNARDFFVRNETA